MGSDFLNISDEPCFSLSAAFKFQCYSGQSITRFSANKSNESATYPDRSSKQIAVMPYKMHLNCIFALLLVFITNATGELFDGFELDESKMFWNGLSIRLWHRKSSWRWYPDLLLGIFAMKSSEVDKVPNIVIGAKRWKPATMCVCRLRRLKPMPKVDSNGMQDNVIQ